MKLKVIPFVVGVLKTVPIRLVKGQEDLETGECAGTMETIALPRSVRILRRVLET